MCRKTLLQALPNPPPSSQLLIYPGAMAISEQGGEHLAFPIPPSSEDPLRLAKVQLSLWGDRTIAPKLAR